MLPGISRESVMQRSLNESNASSSTDRFKLLESEIIRLHAYSRGLVQGGMISYELEFFPMSLTCVMCVTCALGVRYASRCK